MTQYTQRFIIITSADITATANQKSKSFVDTAGGEKTFDVPLESSNAPGTVAYICGWTMTPDQSDEIIKRLKEIESSLSLKVRMFDVSGMRPEDEAALVEKTLADLGLKRPTASPLDQKSDPTVSEGSLSLKK